MCVYKWLLFFLIIAVVDGRRKPINTFQLTKPAYKPKPINIQKPKVKLTMPMTTMLADGSLPISNKTISSHIIAGNSASSGQMPWQAGIIITRSGSVFFCGGSLINPIWVVSAAHCTSGSSQFDVRLGSISPTSGGELITSYTGYTHSGFNPINLNNDIGLIKLPIMAPMSNLIAVVKIVPSATTFFSSLVVSGWGKTTDAATTIAATLQYAPVTSISNGQCSTTYGTSVITTNTICTVGNPKQATCQGDSGGPLVISSPTPYLVGVVSFVANTGCEKGLPSGYIKPQNYRSWLTSITGLTF